LTRKQVTLQTQSEPKKLSTLSDLKDLDEKSLLEKSTKRGKLLIMKQTISNFAVAA
jgi:hypothetical protein